MPYRPAPTGLLMKLVGLPEVFEMSSPLANLAKFTPSTKKPKMSVTLWVGNSSVPNTNCAETEVMPAATLKLKLNTLASLVVEVPPALALSAPSCAFAPLPELPVNWLRVLVFGRLALPDVKKMPLASASVGEEPDVGARLKPV